MGAAVTFDHAGKGTMQESFQEIQDDARYQYGHAGYSGTIAEARGAVRASGTNPMPLEDALALAKKMIWDDDERLEKWGPAIGIPVDDDSWIFVGCYSS